MATGIPKAWFCLPACLPFWLPPFMSWGLMNATFMTLGLPWSPSESVTWAEQNLGRIQVMLGPSLQLGSGRKKRPLWNTGESWSRVRGAENWGRQRVLGGRMERFSVYTPTCDQQGTFSGVQGGEREGTVASLLAGLGRWHGNRDCWDQGQLGIACGVYSGPVWAPVDTGSGQSGGEPQVPGSGGFTPGLDVCFGSPGALVLALAWFPDGRTARPAHLKVIRLGSYFVLTFPSSDLQPCVTSQALYQLAFLSPPHPFTFPISSIPAQDLPIVQNWELTGTLFFPL